MSTYVIGDLQGCYDEFISLLDSIDFEENKDFLYFAGDLVNRGPDSLNCLLKVKSLVEKGCAQTVLGNHDLHMIATYHRVKTIKSKDTIRRIVEHDNAKTLIDWLKAQPLLIHDNRLNTTVCHAGVYPHWTLDQARAFADEVSAAVNRPSPIDYLEGMYGDKPRRWKDKYKGQKRLRFITNCFTRMRFTDKKARLLLGDAYKAKQAPDKYIPWYEVPERPMAESRIVFGHWAALEGITNNEYALSVDTGCVWGGSLTALRLDDGVRISVASRTGADDIV